MQPKNSLTMITHRTVYTYMSNGIHIHTERHTHVCRTVCANGKALKAHRCNQTIQP